MKHISTNSPKICVIGAGPCGIAIAKNLLEHDLKQFVVFEKNHTLGGNWVFDENNKHSSVYETTHIISSKRLSEYEDFPMPKEYPDYPSHHQLLRYFNAYADYFNIKPYLRFNTEVIQVTEISTKQWKIVYRNSAGEHEETFDYLFIANGHHWDPLLPNYPGTFAGTLLHSHQYKKAAPFKDKRVLVIGGGNSACDIAVEIARLSPKTCISMRNGQHIFPKFIFGKPTDVAFSKINWLPHWCKQQLVKFTVRVLQGRYAKYHLKIPKTKPLEVHPTINSELLYSIRHGKVSTRPQIERFEGDHVCFMDGSKEVFDTVIFATGYRLSFPFFNKDLIDYSTATQLPLYLKMIHPEFSKLYFIGLFQPQGCIWPLADYQAKIAARIISGKLETPAKLSTKIQKEIKTSKLRYKPSPRHVLEVDYHQFRKQLLRELKN